MASQESAPSTVEEQQVQDQSEQPQDPELLGPPSPPESDSETPASPNLNTSTTTPRRPHHLTTSTLSNPSFAASTSSSSRRVADGSNNSMISPAATSTSTSSIRSRSGGDRRGPGSVTSGGSERRLRKGPTVPQGTGPYANSTFASRQRSINGEGDKKSEGKPTWR
ncbi:hypothetical protein H072_8172 [Dactylellina haptotyla CBS 200.50]|uniref:Uncharacterized protein n=1 Tax=Dactylellina haptotyla (strain CBS 200.50) TaxID=1284197 RepID=S8A505_DACHA|nr:hypothetical protein H072_8172 [Dactylellina haptotyla CBS 200.50]